MVDILKEELILGQLVVGAGAALHAVLRVTEQLVVEAQVVEAVAPSRAPGQTSPWEEMEDLVVVLVDAAAEPVMVVGAVMASLSHLLNIGCDFL